jgi:hypothetical protein
MISKPDGSRPDSREIEKRSSIHDPSKPEIESPRTDLGQSRGNPRASALADLYRHAAALANAGDIAGARTLHEAIGRLLGDERDLRRRDRPEREEAAVTEGAAVSPSVTAARAPGWL